MEAYKISKKKVKKEVPDASDGGEDLSSYSAEARRRMAAAGVGGCRTGGGRKYCQVEKCTDDPSDSRPYHRRHRVICEHHFNAKAVSVAVRPVTPQRFCRQCNRFHDHELLGFDEAKRCCRRRLACARVDEIGRIPMSIQGTVTSRRSNSRPDAACPALN
ncbi:Squamosa [Dionaea muscipula]